MIGPSSSHTAGALKIGQFARAFLGELPDMVEIYLHGSFGNVYQGHSTDKAIVAGLLGMNTDDENIKNSFEEAKKKNMKFKFIPCNLDVGLHPNTAKIKMFKGKKSFSVTGASIGGGTICITKINEFETNIQEIMKGTYTVIVMHQDAKGVLLAIASALTTENNNIAAIHSVRTAKEGDAMTIVETDEKISYDTLKCIKNENPYIYSIFEIN